MTSPTLVLPSPWPTCLRLRKSKRNLYSSSARIGTLTVLRPFERMIDSFETIEPRFFLIASLMRSLWRSWSMMPFRWSDQSLRWTDITDYLHAVSNLILHSIDNYKHLR